MLYSSWTALSLLLALTGSLPADAQNAPSHQQLTTQTPAAAPAKEESRLTSSFRFEMGGQNFSEGQNEGLISHLGLSARVGYQLAPWLRAKIEPKADFYSARAQERSQSDAYQNRLGLTEGYVSLEPIEYLELRAGTHSQKILENPLLVSGGRAFPGLQEIVRIPMGNLGKIELIAQQVVPTSYSNNSLREEKEALPSFTTESLHLTLTPNRRMKIHAFGGHYRWSNLPSAVAFNSAQLGNSVEGEVAPGAEFSYEFEGLFGGTRGSFRAHRHLELAAGFKRAQNTRADSRVADSQMWDVAPSIKTRDLDVTASYGQFMNESDVTPAFYSSARFGHTNRAGQSAGVKLDFKKYDFAINGEWVQSLPINVDPFQQALTTIAVWLEIDYAPL
jgi:hypothetical protein